MLENYLDGVIHDLVVNHVVSSFKMLKREVGEDDGYIRVKCNLSNGDILEFAEYIRVIKNMIRHETYSFHWRSADGKLVKRWDNVKHHKDVGTYPYLNAFEHITAMEWTQALRKLDYTDYFVRRNFSFDDDYKTMDGILNFFHKTITIEIA